MITYHRYMIISLKVILLVIYDSVSWTHSYFGAFLCEHIKCKKCFEYHKNNIKVWKGKGETNWWKIKGKDCKHIGMSLSWWKFVFIVHRKKQLGWKWITTSTADLILKNFHLCVNIFLENSLVTSRVLILFFIISWTNHDINYVIN